MAALAVSIGLFVVAWLAHLAWWRVSLPRRHTFALAGIFGVVPCVAAAFWLASGASVAITPADIPGVLALYAGAAGCYLITYSGIEQTSPSLLIVRALEAAGPAGHTRVELGALITEDVFVRPRIDALRLDGLLAPTDAGWVLTTRGRKLARTGVAFARWFNIRESA